MRKMLLNYVLEVNNFYFFLFYDNIIIGDNMIEIINVDGIKMMAMVVADVKYMDDNYIIYCIDRGNNEANIFVSRLVISSDGYVFNNNFSNSEKEVLDNLIKRIINKDDINKDGFIISNTVELVDVNYFDVEKCYVATVSKSMVKDIMINYRLVNKKIFERPVVEVVEDKKVFNEGFIGNIFLIILGVAVIMFCGFVLVGVFR